jgi:hypothetical protein
VSASRLWQDVKRLQSHASCDVVALLIVEARVPVSLLDERRERTLFEIMFENKKNVVPKPTTSPVSDSFQLMHCLVVWSSHVTLTRNSGDD